MSWEYLAQLTWLRRCFGQWLGNGSEKTILKGRKVICCSSYIVQNLQQKIDIFDIPFLDVRNCFSVAKIGIFFWHENRMNGQVSVFLADLEVLYCGQKVLFPTLP